MPFNVRAAGVWQEVAKVHARVAGVWTVADQVWGYSAGGWRSAWQNEIRYINTSARTGASIFELMGSPTQAGNYVFENQATISAGTGTFALRTGVFPAGSTLHIVNKGTIQGRGGTGGLANYSSRIAQAGGAGGDAILIDYPCTIDNGAGYLIGGGGGGGGAYSSYIVDPPARGLAAGGGGGAGTSAGAGGVASNATAQQSGAAGTATTGGVGGNVLSNGSRATGGNGGGQGAAGAASSQSGGGSIQATSAGGAAGKAVNKGGNVVTITAGNDTTRIKGAVA